MLQATRWQMASLAIGAALLFGLAGSSFAQGKKAHEKHDSAALYYSLRDVINTGGKLYNANGDHAGCYRMYQGSLLSVRPFLAPSLQKKIDEGIAKAEKMGSYADRSFELRRVLDEIRETVKPPESKDKGQVSGTVVYLGKPVPAGFSVVFVDGSGSKISCAIKDGTFAFKEAVPVGEYRIAIAPGPDAKAGALPARYTSEKTSSLVIRVAPGKQQVDLNLVK